MDPIYGGGGGGGGQVQNKHIKRLIHLQNKAIRVINFESYHSPVNILFKTSKILKIYDVIKLQNFMYIYQSINGNLPITLRNIFKPTETLHGHNTRGSSHHQLSIPKANTLVYGIKSINYQSMQFWNFIVNMFPENKLQIEKKNNCKRFITNYLLDNYEK